MSYNIGIESGNSQTFSGLSWTRSGTDVTITHSGHAVGTATGNSIKITACSDTSTIPLGYYSNTIAGTATTIRITGVNTGAASGTLSYQYSASRGVTTTITPTTQMSFSLWIKPAKISANLRLFDAATATRRLIFGTTGTTLNYQYINNGGANTADFSINLAAAEITENNWHHICITHDGTLTTNVPIIYINGVSQTVTTVTSPTGSAQNTPTVFYIGNNAGRIRSFNGKIAELSFWSKVLAPSQVSELFLGVTPARNISGLLTHSPLLLNRVDRINASPITDDSVAGYPTQTLSDDHPKILSS